MSPRARQLRDRTLESELKFKVGGAADHARLRAALRKRGGHFTGRYREQNFRFDGPGKSTRRVTLRLRVLNGGPHGFLTVKGPATFAGGVKIREETEMAISDTHTAMDLLDQLGFRIAWTYPKTRSMWSVDGVAVTLDVLDFGWFVELEGPVDRLGGLATELGLDPSTAVRESYSVLARKHQRSLSRRSAARPIKQAAQPAPG